MVSRRAFLSAVGAGVAGTAVVAADAHAFVPLPDDPNRLTRGRATLRGHEQPVRSLAFAPDSKTLASVSSDGSIRIWDAAAGKELVAFQGLSAPKGFLSSVAFSSDGKRLATGGAEGDRFEGFVKVWAADTYKELIRLDVSVDAKTVAFSPDGTLLAAPNHREVKLWSSANGREWAAFHGHNGVVMSAAFSPDGKTVASACMDTTVRLWDLPSHVEIASLPHQGQTWFAAFSPDGKRLASCWCAPAANGLPQQIGASVWDVAGRKLESTCQGHQRPVMCLAFSPDSALLATASNDQTLRLWLVRTGKELAALQVPAPNYCVSFSLDGKLLATGGDRAIRLWDVTRQQ